MCTVSIKPLVFTQNFLHLKNRDQSQRKGTLPETDFAMDNLNSDRFNCEDIVTKYKCEDCDFISDLRIILNDHIWDHHKRLQNYGRTYFKMKRYSCRTCSTISYSLLVRLAHRRKCINAAYASKVGNKSCSGSLLHILPSVKEKVKSYYTDLENFLHCKSCEFKTRRRRNLQRHITTRHTDLKDRVRHKCSQCLFQTLDRTALRRHIIRDHTDPEETKWFKCDSCDYKAKLKSYLAQHVTLKHPSEDQVYQECSQCSYKTVFKSCLKKHIMARHTDPEKIKWFLCDQCGHRVKDKNHLNIRIKRKHARGTQVYHECDQCTYKTLSKRDLGSHINARHTEPEKMKSYDCDRCGYKAKTQSNLKKHRDLEHIYGCDNCSFKGVRKCNLKRHMLTHHVEARRT